MKIIQTISNFYNKLSNFGKILIFLALFLLVIHILKPISQIRKEGMTNVEEKFVYKDGQAVYDDFYADIYDYLVFNQIKNDYEIGTIINSTSPTSQSVIADIGCGTGHHVNELISKDLNVIGVDSSKYMINKAKQLFPQYSNNFVIGNALNNNLFNQSSLTHILCLYFTIYYMEDKMKFFYNCMDWLMPGGFLIVHLVDREKFDPILPPGNPLYIVSPQKYAKERITKTKITFNDFVYESNFNYEPNKNLATFDEKFKFDDGKVRKQQQKLHMEDTDTIVRMAQEAGFLIHAKIDMLKCAYENQYLYIFIKPN